MKWSDFNIVLSNLLENCKSWYNKLSGTVILLHVVAKLSSAFIGSKRMTSRSFGLSN